MLKNGSLEFDLFADILKTADALYIGSLFKLGKVALNYMDYCFVRKLHYFLAESENIEQEKKEGFLCFRSKLIYRVNGLDGQARTLRAFKKCHESTRCGFDSHLTLW